MKNNDIKDKKEMYFKKIIEEIIEEYIKYFGDELPFQCNPPNDDDISTNNKNIYRFDFPKKICFGERELKDEE